MASEDDETPTPIACDACDGSWSDCLVCGGTGLISAELRRKRSSAKMRRVSETHVKFADMSKELLEKLESRPRTHHSQVLIDKIREIDTELRRWLVENPSDEVRVKTINDLAHWHRLVLDFLSGSR